MLSYKKTKIVCTIGPASRDLETLTAMMRSGMNVARINFAHGSFEDHRKTIANVRAASAQAERPIAIFGDLPGPKMRIGKLASEPIELVSGQPFTIQVGEIVGDQERVSMDFAGLPKAVKPGDSIYMNDGYIQLRVEDVVGDEVRCRVEVGGELRSHKGVNFPGIDLGISAFTEQDREFLAFAAEQELDAVSQSFVQDGADIRAVRAAAEELDYDPMILAKIERAGAVLNIEEILEESDGIMVARGDLGVETPIEEIPAVQKDLIRRANLAAKPVITATQMLESMTQYRRPTRAEVTDVANAILDGTDCVMLSGETAIGAHPIETVDVMARIAYATETANVGRFGLGATLIGQLALAHGGIEPGSRFGFSVYRLAEGMGASIVFVPSFSGSTARRIARYRLPIWVVAITRDERVCRRLVFTYGVHSVTIHSEHLPEDPARWRDYVLKWMDENQVEGKTVLLVEGPGTLGVADSRRIDIIDLDAGD
jgi:pyruvate kinase